MSPLGFTPLGAFGNPLRLPAVFGESAAAATQRAAVTPARQRELSLSELEVITVLELVTEEYGADRSRTFLAGHSMGSGGAWHLAARYPERWRAVAPMSGPFIDAATYPFDLIRKLPIFMTEGTGATPSLAGQPRAGASSCAAGSFVFEYLEVDGNHGSMVPMVWPACSSSSIACRRARGRASHEDVRLCSRRAAAPRSACSRRAAARRRSGCGRTRRPARKSWTVPESVSTSPTGDRTISNVSDPTLTVFLPDPAIATGTAVVLAPGGAMRVLGMDSDGTQVAKWLNEKGIAAFVLKYRTLQQDPAAPRGPLAGPAAGRARRAPGA